jgi:hypothetical protein
MMAETLRIHLWVLPRWFAVPVSTGAVVLGGVVSGAPPFYLAMAALIGALLMGWSHAMNSWIDYELTGFDKGDETERSHKKPYTGGQNLIAEGLCPKKVLGNGLVWLGLALALTVFMAFKVSPWILLPVLLTIPMTFAYSYGKKFWMPEIVLGLGFGPIAAMLGAAGSPNPMMMNAFLVGIPIGILFGFGAEVYDQWYDADANWDRGLRNIGAVVWHKGFPVLLVVGAFVAVTFIAQATLINNGYLTSGTGITSFALLGFVPAILLRDARKPVVIMGALAGVFIYSILLPLGQVL